MVARFDVEEYGVGTCWHHFFARNIASGGPPGGLPAANADPRHTPALAARLAQARKKIGAPSLACGAHLLAEGSP